MNAPLKRFVFDNTDLNDTDLRQHRLGLWLMADGEPGAFHAAHLAPLPLSLRPSRLLPSFYERLS